MALATKRIGSSWKEHMELLQLVYNAFPGAIETPTSYGHLPLHTVCNAKTMHAHFVLFFLDKFPHAASIKDPHGGWVPLAYSIQKSSVYKTVVKKPVKAAPETIEFEYNLDKNK